MTYPHGGAGQIWRDGNAGAYNPKKSEIRDWGAGVETRVSALEGRDFTQPNPKMPVELVAGANVTALLGEQVIDGVMTSTSRVLLIKQTNAEFNGVWVTSSGEWVRAGDCDTGEKIAWATVFVEAGVMLSGTEWICAESDITIDVDSLNWVQVGGGYPTPTGEQVKAAYEAEPNTNAYTDVEKARVARLRFDTHRKWLWGVVDVVGRRALAVNDAGELFSKGENVTRRILEFVAHALNVANPHNVTKAQVGLGSADNTADVDKPVSNAQQAALDTKLEVEVQDNRNFLWGVVDLFGRMPLAITSAGDLVVRGVNVASILTARAVSAVARLIEDDRRSGYLWGILDASDRVAFGLSPSGGVLFKGTDVTDHLDGTADAARIAENAARVAEIAALSTSGNDIVCWGDSLTEGAGATGWSTAYPQQLAALTGRTVTVLGRGGQTAEQVAARAGGRAALLSVAGNEIPASGSVVVTSLSVCLMAYAGGAWSMAGSLAGVPGTLDEDGSGGYTFTRKSAGVAVDCLPDTPFIPTTVYPDRLHIIWVGRNNYSGVTDPVALVSVNDTIKDCIASIVGTMDPVEKRFLVLGVTSRDDVNEYVGTANYDAKRDLVADLARSYPKQFIDIDAILRAGGDGGTVDNADIANGVLPTSLTAADRIHLSDAGYGVVAAACDARITFNDSYGW